MLPNGNKGSAADTPARPQRYEFSIRVPPEMLRNAAARYMWRRFRWRYIAGWAGVGLGVAAYSLSDLGALTTALGIVTGILALVLVILPFVIWHRVKQTGEGYATLTGGAPVFYEVDDEWLVSQYANGSGELRWSAFGEIMKLDEVWLLLMAHEERFIPLPVEQVPDDALQFIESEIAAHGGG